MFSCSHRRGGFVLVSVLMLGVLLISCATAFTWFVRLQVRSVLRERVALTNRSMAQVLSRAVINAIAEVSGRTSADSPTQAWFKPLTFPTDDLGTWRVQVTPLDDRFPIRNLFLPDGNTLRMELRDLWEDLWEALGHRELAVPVLDFLDKNDTGRVGGVERESFINRAPLDMSEFLMMGEMTEGILYGEEGRPGLEDFCTIWSDGRINLNVAPVRVLELLPGLDRTRARQLAEYRRENALGSMADVQAMPGFSARTSMQLTNLAVFKSRYFALHIEFLDTSAGGTAFDIIFDRTARKVVRWEES